MKSVRKSHNFIDHVFYLVYLAIYGQKAKIYSVTILCINDLPR